MREFLLWDHDGVLVDTERWYYAATRDELESVGIALDQATYLRFMATGRSCWDLAHERKVPGRQIEAARQRRDRRYQEYLSSEDIEMDGVMDVLAQLKGRYRMAIVSTSRRADFELIHRRRELRQFFDFVINIEDCVRPKPAPEPYLAALERFGTTPERALAIEDSSRGLASAVAAGLDCAIVRSDFTAAQDFGSACCVLDSIRDVPNQLTVGCG